MMKLNFDPVTQDPPENDGKSPASVRTFTIESSGKKLIGSILIAGGDEFHPTVILLNGFPGNDTNSDIAHSIRRAGYNVVNFNYRGSWGSEGEYSWSNCIEDSQVVINYFKSGEVKENYKSDPNKIVIVGHSMGGFISLMNMVIDPQLKHACSFAGFNFGLWANFIISDAEIKQMSLERMAESVSMLKGTSAEKLLSEMIENHEKWNLLNGAQSLTKKNVLLIAAKYDQLAPVQLHHTPLANVLQKSGTMFTQKILNTGHSFSDKRIELTREIINWLTNIEF